MRRYTEAKGTLMRFLLQGSHLKRILTPIDSYPLSI